MKSQPSRPIRTAVIDLNDRLNHKNPNYWLIYDHFMNDSKGSWILFQKSRITFVPLLMPAYNISAY